MIANFLFFIFLFFIFGVIFNFLKEITFLLLIILIYLLYKKAKIKFLFLFIISFLFGFLYTQFYFYLLEKQDNYITIKKELAPSEKYNRYLAIYKNKEYILYTPYYLNLNPQSKIEANFEIYENKIFLKEIKKVKQSFYEPIFILKDKINEVIRKSYSINSSEIISGILYGEEIKNLELRNDLKNTGLLHITAMSGYNLTIIINAVFYIFSLLGFSLFATNILSIIFIILFVIFTGFQSSVIRAAIMTIALIFSKIEGRIPLTRNILIFTSFLITLFSPDALIKDLGFQLSFLATIGILYLSDGLSKFLKNKILSETVSAQLMVMPLLWYKFSEFNLFSFLNNMLLVPLIPFLMILGFIALFVFYFYPINQIINFPFEIFAFFLSLLSNLPKIYLPIPLILVLLLYIYLSYLIYKFNRDEKIDFNFSLD